MSNLKRLEWLEKELGGEIVYTETNDCGHSYKEVSRENIPTWVLDSAEETLRSIRRNRKNVKVTDKC